MYALEFCSDYKYTQALVYNPGGWTHGPQRHTAKLPAERPFVGQGKRHTTGTQEKRWILVSKDVE